MRVPRALRVWGWSVLACAVVAGLVSAVAEAAVVGGSLGTVAETTGLVALTYAVVGLAICLPAFALLGQATNLVGRRALASLVGAFLATCASLALVVWVFRSPTDPMTLGGWLEFWSRNAVRFTVGIAPFALAGAVFGSLWARPDPPSPPDESADAAGPGRRGGARRVRT